MEWRRSSGKKPTFHRRGQQPTGDWSSMLKLRCAVSFPHLKVFSPICLRCSFQLRFSALRLQFHLFALQLLLRLFTSQLLASFVCSLALNFVDLLFLLHVNDVYKFDVFLLKIIS